MLSTIPTFTPPSPSIYLSESCTQAGRKQKLDMGAYSNLVNIVRRKLGKSKQERTIVLLDHIHDKNLLVQEEEKEEDEEEEKKGCQEIEVDENAMLLSKERDLSEEEVAVVKIQAFFRGYLARQAFRALRSVVKMQALVRGVQVRRQSQIALHCMHALVRLHVTIRARKLLNNV